MILDEPFLNSMDEHICSDSFAKDGDASTQYNCEPFMNENRPRLRTKPIVLIYVDWVVHYSILLPT